MLSKAKSFHFIILANYYVLYSKHIFQKKRLSTSKCSIELTDNDSKEKRCNRICLNERLKNDSGKKVKCQQYEFGYSLTKRKQLCRCAEEDGEYTLNILNADADPLSVGYEQSSQKGVRLPQIECKKVEDGSTEVRNPVDTAEKKVEDECEELDEAQEKELLRVLDYDRGEMHRRLRNMGFSPDIFK
ncbi:hypothetical protein KIN20_016187 [Parelaphostrongylus tenuis]|uniref:Uncharacterized protein n=1 Tax=Parelaphostrongylus tenuis TaxID=148309 RepID=A0AAD5QMT1_PARTN|nr:hypothetical protein KIN20_016187 [Parelaphostrongylus tenuis]